MPFWTYTIQRGTTQRNILVTAQAPDRRPVAGLSHDAAGARAGFVRDDGVSGEIELVAGTPGRFDSGGFVEVDPAAAPGVYQFGVPDAVLAPGATRAAIVLQTGDAWFEPVDIELVAFDAQEPERIGMEALAFESRIRCLTTAFPLLAVEEQRRLAERESAS